MESLHDEYVVFWCLSSVSVRESLKHIEINRYKNKVSSVKSLLDSRWEESLRARSEDLAPLRTICLRTCIMTERVRCAGHRSW